MLQIALAWIMFKRPRDSPDHWDDEIREPRGFYQYVTF